VKQSGEHLIAADAESVWRALNDPEVLKSAIEGCERLERIADDRFEGVVKVKVGPVSAAFTGEVTLSDLDPPRGYTLSASAKGGPAGFGKGTARVTLTPEAGGVRLAYEVDAQVGGKLAQVGQRLIDAAARQMADNFFTRFAEAVGGPPEIASESAPPAVKNGTGLRAWIIVGVVVVLLGLLIALRR
jgi:uncharacterized protein